MNKHKTRQTVVENLKVFFSKSQENAVTVEEALTAWGRTLENLEKDKAWFSNKLTDLKFYDLVKPFYTLKNNRRVLERIVLTNEGRQALGRPTTKDDIEEPVNILNNQSRMSISDVMKIISKLREDNPEYHITFDIKLRDPSA